MAATLGILDATAAMLRIWQLCSLGSSGLDSPSIILFSHWKQIPLAFPLQICLNLNQAKSPLRITPGTHPPLPDCSAEAHLQRKLLTELVINMGLISADAILSHYVPRTSTATG